MPQFFDTDGGLLALWSELIADDGTLKSYSNLNLIWDKDYSLTIAPIREYAPVFNNFKTVQSIISDYIQGARTDAFRVLTKYGVTEGDYDSGIIVIKVDENGSVPTGVYAASRIIELTQDYDFTKLETTIYVAHTLALISQYALGDRDFLQNNLTNYCISQSEIAMMKKGTTGPLKQTIKILSPKDFADLIEKFKDDDAIKDLYESTLDTQRIDIHLIEIDKDKSEITYNERNKIKSKHVTFKTLKNIISEIKQ